MNSLLGDSRYIATTKQKHSERWKLHVQFRIASQGTRDKREREKNRIAAAAHLDLLAQILAFLRKVRLDDRLELCRRVPQVLKHGDAHGLHVIDKRLS